MIRTVLVELVASSAGSKKTVELDVGDASEMNIRAGDAKLGNCTAVLSSIQPL